MTAQSSENVIKTITIELQDILERSEDRVVIVNGFFTLFSKTFHYGIVEDWQFTIEHDRVKGFYGKVSLCFKWEPFKTHSFMVYKKNNPLDAYTRAMSVI